MPWFIHIANYDKPTAERDDDGNTVDECLPHELHRKSVAEAFGQLNAKRS